MSQNIETARRVIKLESDALLEMANKLDESFDQAIEACFKMKGRVICAGVGKSGHVARKISATLASTGTPSIFVHPTEASHGDLGMITQDDVVIALSRSGETSELSDLIHYTQRFSIPLIGLTAVASSTLAKGSNIQLLVPDAAEACASTKAPTTSTTLMMAMGDCLAVALLEKHGFGAEDFRVFHPGGKLGAMLKTARDLMNSGESMPIVKSGTSLNEALTVISGKKVGCVGVINETGHLTGMLTDGDLRRLLAARQTAETVDEAMTKAPTTTTPDALASSILAIMNKNRFTQIFVIENDKPVGVVHMHDLLKAGVS